ncbi:DUF1194 domain-containing protein [Silicimonas sp. MF1-12-2]|uniref:DUF1194 domain-containing protein n=1 Tax=Silicimonas sp. MF1-12-2 TaxID=3384793 RepID=UPI0039B69B9C
MNNILSCSAGCVLALVGSAASSQSTELDPLEVDLELVLAADRSGSMSADLRSSQRLGFAAAFRDRELQRAIVSGPIGKIAVLYFEWSDRADQEVIIPWTVLASAEDMNAFANTLQHAAIASDGGETSISAAMMFAVEELETNRFSSYRRVVDISGNGRNSSGQPVEIGLRALRAVGATVNGLALPETTYGNAGPYDKLFTGFDGPIEDYYRREVIGGPGAFAIVVDPDNGFADEILRKLVLEVAWNGSTNDFHGRKPATMMTTETPSFR